jgi:hypothetical protein
MISGLILGMIGIFLIIFSDVFWISSLGMSLLVMGMIAAYNLTYIFVTEMVEESNRQQYKIVIAFIFSIGAVFDVLWFFLIPNYEKVLLFFYVVPVAAITIIFMYFFHDTPISLITKNPP